jgi:hypothetical protein
MKEICTMTSSTSEPTQVPAKQITTTDSASQASRVGRKRDKPTAIAQSKTRPARSRAGTKTAKIVRLLQRPGGASLAELTKATGWQPHSVRGFLSGAVRAKMRLKISSMKRDDGERAYHLPSK